MGTQYVIVGGSAAGMAAAHTIRKKDSSGIITVLSNEKTAPYFRPMIPYIINGKKQVSDIGLSGKGMFTAKGIDVRTAAAVVSVDTAGKTVKTGSDENVPYDKILFATGSRPYMPETVNGLEAPGVFSLKTVADAVAMADRSRKTDHAVMLGGGILNLKAAFALLEKKIKVTLVVYSPEVLSQLMDPEDAFLVRKALDTAGLSILTGCSATDIITDTDGVCAVALDNGKELPCRMVCVGKGVIPNTDFLHGSDIKIDRGIIADTTTACSVKDTFAAGDVAVTYDSATGEKTVTALWTNAVEMGICAGLNMAGINTRYSGTLGIMNATQVANEPFVSMGIVHTKDKDVETHIKTSNNTYRKIVFNKKGTCLVGALFIGDITNAGMYRYVIREKKPIAGIKSHLINHTLHYGHFM
ncbi:MAG: FAD-dependent oxidoreductase [Proteobacteria bacterium]|nr:FAD-dependent oxidoreductase [Pseudomonadota bacterium]MBU1582037.1 FAD-dependent oxidoreductase [Pseudomonadota bacterium]MBU2454417.1 FAD-dependent oxidoreductase [Pseudomonadota bacterium]MBU2630469.1 FAD-dependent oxidoreductase [Pseudomonadota bacterium]